MHLQTLEAWLENPVTELLLKHVKEIRDANATDINGYVLNSPSLQNLDTHLLAQLKGQVHALDMVLDIKTLLSSELEEEKEDVQPNWAENQD